MKKYLIITRKIMLGSTMFRFNFIFSIFSNMLYIAIVYFLWNSIYSSGAKSLNGMTFNQVFVYLSMASTISILFTTYVEWDMSEEVIDGSIIMNLIKPVDLQLYKFFENLGFVLLKLLTVTFPSILLIILVFKPGIQIGWNIPFFIFTLILSYLIKFNIDFFVGLLCFYNESTWGMSSAKDSIVMLLSGAIIPISFFPEFLKTIVNLLPFQAIFNIPLTIFINKDLTVNEYIRSILVQLVWIVLLFVINRLFYRKAIKVITVNGG